MSNKIKLMVAGLLTLVALLGAGLLLAPAALAAPGGGNGQGRGNGAMAGMPGAGSGYGAGYGRQGGSNTSLLMVAADKLGLTRAELVAALGGAKSIAQVAGEHNVATATIVDAFVAPRVQRLAAMVQSGRLTQAQADQMLAQMRDNVTSQLDEVWSPRGTGQGAGNGDGNGDGICDYYPGN